MDVDEEFSALDREALNLDTNVKKTPQTSQKRTSTSQTRSGRTSKRRKVDDYSSESDSNSEDADEEEQSTSKPESLRESSDEENDPDWRDSKTRRSRTKPQTYNVKALFQDQLSKARPTPAKRGRPRGSYNKGKTAARLVQVQDEPEKKELDFYLKTIPDHRANQPVEEARLFTASVYELEAVKSSSGGFNLFVHSMTDQNTLDIYTFVAERYHFPEDSNDAMKIAQSLRHAWNKLPAGARKNWEATARSRAKEHSKKEPPKTLQDVLNEEMEPTAEGEKKPKDYSLMPVNEIPYMSVDRCQQTAIVPQCCPNAPVWRDFNDVKRHMLRSHYTAFFYGCHFCHYMFQTREQMEKHECNKFSQFMINRIVAGNSESPEMTAAYIFVACYECGLWMPIRETYTGDRLEQAWCFFSAICNNHAGETLNLVVVYTVEALDIEGPESYLKFKYMPHTVRNLPLSCDKCDISFTSAKMANTHMYTHEPKKCTCGKEYGTESHFKHHIFTHFPSKTCFGRYLGDQCVVYPPVDAKGAVPRVGFKKENAPAVGGFATSAENDSPYEFVDHCEPLLEEKLKNSREPRKLDEDEDEGYCADQTRPDKGHEDADFTETLADNEKQEEVKLLLNKIFCKQLAGGAVKNGLLWTDKVMDWAGLSEKLKLKENMTEDDIDDNAKQLVFPHSQLMAELAESFQQTVSLPSHACYDSLSEAMLDKDYEICDECSMIYSLGNHVHSCDASKIHQLFKNGGPRDSRLECYLCGGAYCSIYGLRSHLAWDHLRYFETAIRPSEQANGTKETLMSIAVDNMLKESRSLVSKRTDFGLKLGGNNGKLRPKSYRPQLCRPSYQQQQPVSAVYRRPVMPSDTRRFPVAARQFSITNRDMMLQQSPQGQRPTTVRPFLENTNGRIGFTCRFCQFSTADMKKMREHLRVAHTIICRGCGQAVAYANTLTEHEKTCTRPFGNVPVGTMSGVCICCRRRDPLPRLYTHIFEAHMNLVCYGTSCGMIFRRDTNQLFVKDIQLIQPGILMPPAPAPRILPLPRNRVNPEFSQYVKKNETNYECYLCAFESSNVVDHKKHLLRHSERWSRCPFCVEHVPIASHDEMAHHLQTQHFSFKDENTHVCNACMKVFHNSNVSHIVYNCTLTRRCALCPEGFNRTFENPEEMKIHWKMIHKKQFERFGCSECQAKFATLKEFKMHSCRTVEMAHRCDCGQLFDTKGDYIDHYWSHVDPERTGCLLCQRPFAANVTVAQHRAIHGRVAANAKERKIKIIDEPLFIADCREVVEVVELDGDNDSTLDTPDSTSIATDEEESDEGIERAVEKAVRKLVKGVCLEMGEPYEEQITTMEDALNSDLSARVRTETDDVQVISHHPGYVEEADDLECCPSPPAGGAAVVKPVTDQNGDDEISVVAEVENPSGTLPSNVSATARAKNFKCSKCSQMFLTKAAACDHETKSHKTDAGGILDKAYGVPENLNIYLCRNCCVAFESPSVFRRHNAAHGINSGISCPHCSGISYNVPLFEQHQACHKRTDKSRLYFGCGTCMKMFLTDTRLYHHMNTVHNIPLLFFCKCCSLCSGNINVIVDHINKTVICRNQLGKKGFTFLQMFGVFPANLVHFQPNNPEHYENLLRAQLIKAVTPSECSHRTFLTLTDSVMTCKECHCTMSTAAFHAIDAAKNNGYHDALITIDDSSEFPFQKELTANTTSRRYPYQQLSLKTGGPTVRAALQANLRFPPIQPRPSSNFPPPSRIPGTPTYATIASNALSSVARGVRSNVLQTARQGLMAAAQAQRQTKSTAKSTNDDDDIIMLDNDTPSSSSTSRAKTVVPPPTRSTTRTFAQHRKGVPQQQQPPEHCNVCKANMIGPKVKRLHDLHKNGKAWFCLDCANAHTSEIEAVKHYYQCHIPDGQKSHETKKLPGEFRPMAFDLHCPFPGCTNEMKTLNELRKHLETKHTDQLKFTSSYCSAKFVTEAAAKAHEEAHVKFEEENGISGVCCQLCGEANQWNLQCEVLGSQKMISHLAIHGLHTYTMCRDCFTCFQNDFDNSKIINHIEVAHLKKQADGLYHCSMCDYKLPKDRIGKHVLDKHMVRGYKTRAKSDNVNQLVVKATGITKNFLGLPVGNEDEDKNE